MSATEMPSGDRGRSRRRAESGAGLPVARSELSTRVESEATALLEEVYSGHRLLIAGGGGGSGFDARVAEVGAVRAARMRNTREFTAEMDPSSHFSAGLLVGGLVEIDNGREHVRLARGDLLMHHPDRGATSRAVNPDLATLTLPLTVVKEAAEARTGLPADSLEFWSMSAVSPEMRQYFADVVTFVHRQLLQADELPVLVVDQFAQLVASAALSTFPHSMMGLDHLPGPGRAAPSVVRRAIAYMEENAGRSMTVVDVATAVGVSARALQAAFARAGTTPMTYLRRVRLERAHGELRTGDRGAGDTVARTAARWGFTNPGRFSALYLEAYGRLPDQTLRGEEG